MVPSPKGIWISCPMNRASKIPAGGGGGYSSSPRIVSMLSVAIGSRPKRRVRLLPASSLTTIGMSTTWPAAEPASKHARRTEAAPCRGFTGLVEGMEAAGLPGGIRRGCQNRRGGTHNPVRNEFPRYSRLHQAHRMIGITLVTDSDPRHLLPLLLAQRTHPASLHHAASPPRSVTYKCIDSFGGKCQGRSGPLLVAAALDILPTDAQS